METTDALVSPRQLCEFAERSMRTQKPRFPSTQEATQLFAVTWVSYAGFYLCRTNFSVLIPVLAAKEGMSRNQLAEIVFALSVSYALGQFVMGVFSDRIGPRRVVAAGMFVSAIAMIAMGFFPHFMPLVMLQAINGVAQATGWSGLSKLMSRRLEGKHRAVLMAWWSTNYVAGSLLATLLTTFAITAQWFTWSAWRNGFWIPAVCLLILGTFFYRAVPMEAAVADSMHPRQRPTLSDIIRDCESMLQDSKVRLIAAAYFLVKMTRYSLLFWLPLYLTDSLKMPFARAGYISSVFQIVGIAGVLAAGYLSDFVFRSHRLPVAFLFTCMLACGCFFTSMIEPSVRYLSLFDFAILGACTFGADTLLVGVATQESVVERKVGTAMGFVDGCGSFGQLLAPVLVANVSQLFGWPSVFRCLGVAAVVCSCILWGGCQTERRATLQAKERLAY